MTSRGGGVPGGVGRDRFRREFTSSRFESSNSNGKRGNNPPSRHLWVGNLSHSIEETDLTDEFLQFGDLDSVAFQPGRSYAFVNFNKEEDAIAAIKSLQGYPLAGNPLRIEFAKADKSSTPSHDEDYLQRRDEQRLTLRGSPFLQRDSRVRNASPETFYPDKSKMSDNSAEPSEVLWIGFPALLKVDEMILRKAFSPFGEIEKITVFPGRSYAFVRFTNLTSACRAKETLQGKLFGNPRVHICFAKNEAGSSNSGRTPLSPHYKPNSRQGGPENFWQDRNFGSTATDPSIRSPRFNSDLDPADSDVYGLNRKGTLHQVGNGAFDNWRFGEELGPPPDVYERHGSPTRGRDAHFHEFAKKNPQKGPFYEEPWDLPEDSYLYHEAKKLKTGSFPPDKELPEYPYSDLEQERRAFPRAFSDFPQPEAFDKNLEAGPFGYTPIQDRPINLSLPHGERSDPWKVSYDNFQAGSGSLPTNRTERKRFTPEPEPSSLKLWKWEGTIAKGGTPVCHARCFPVGKALDFMLPDFLDCTARTGLDMLAKHYYQAASAWVVFFVPASDADMGYYNELMHYLEEKQRAAVAKLDDKTTLFLVPPSDFSEKVLRVPGKLSISGVILRDPSYPKPPTHSGQFPAMVSFSDLSRSGGDPAFLGNVASTAPPVAFSGPAHPAGSISDSYNESRHHYPLQQQNSTLRPNWSPHHSQSIVSGNRNVPSQASNTAVDPVIPEHHSVLPRTVQENGPAHFASGMSTNPVSGNSKSTFQETKPSVPVSLPIAGLQPQQLAQLASSLLGQQRLLGNNSNGSASEDFKRTVNQSGNQVGIAQALGLHKNQVGSEMLTSQFSQLQQMQQQQVSNVPTSVPPPVRKELQPGAQGNPRMESAGTQEEADGDPQKRLQATLQLAAALLQQIQQGKGT
ncbi:flowering time control protein FPA isoform X2 [Populus trichocarpa]|uniref:RRM domain-containing protein n=1 Tax=Populus trichocarpa TaxID=3694 RepID=A0A3N7HRR2_POPTR|nr:flowering time control protein FPA isoform X2 [Populus trichocarpa]|eukprot:XP_024440498.1 flowering time control protein FPA isoform X2 [Populus trichocarpa]